ncbi:p-aminobenzoate synthetase [Acinetobacter junii]|uniref:aminodeoxychorismate synthase component I n=1 Tax=Acinetobacter junii TaxID=40215 RepID=UPI0002CFC94D|nr:aminodeoxychorismate synthase component I [Acinetobacter junii]ENV67461.1 aminodeoxychorismate synthase, component I [Acinetobacter junii CIP 64.5]SUU19959.1 p-aminobenzoate synthetase [Acinetobacter junii]SUU22431.1 p-aminobenzoate synthetase [Acinetobacter junii]
MSQFKQKLNISSLSVSEILFQLRELIGLVYLHDQNSPIISFLPKHYLIFENSTSRQFTQLELNQYHQITHPLSIINFVQFSKNPISTIESISFKGGYIGFISYDYCSNLCVKTAMRSQPSLFLGEYSSYLKYHNGEWYFYGNEKKSVNTYNYILSLLSKNKSDQLESLSLQDQCTPRWSKTKYLQAFSRIQDYIKAGDCYQINLTQEFTAKAKGSLLSKSNDFWQLTHAPYAGYVKINEFELLSCSPELFIEFDNKNKIKTRPIKGTMPRHQDPQQDLISKEKLTNSKKDQAENVMIVDLLRNDLSVYAETGSVKTTKLFEIESFNQVHHMVSEITATLKEEVNPMQMLLSALPGGSITGAPKIRAMQIIDELEESPRGAYCGSLGYFNYDGTGRWNILIRSIQKNQDNLSIWAGGGITIASDAEAEYQECFDKVSAMLDLLNTWQK